MTANNKPEIELEVSCGGTFKISTEAMACRITVLDSARQVSSVQQRQPPEQEAVATPPSVTQEQPGGREVLVEDSYFKETVGTYSVGMQDILDGMAAVVGKSLDEQGSAGAIAARVLPAETEALIRQRLTEEGGAIAKAQAKIVDQRFTLTFLKNYPIFSRRDPEAEEITVCCAELDKLHGKIKSAMHTAVQINEALAKVKDALMGEGEASEILTPIASLVDGQRQMIDAFCGLQIMQEEKEADSTVAFAVAREKADDRLASLQEKGNSGEESADTSPDLSDQDAIDSGLNAAVDDSAAAGGDEEMSDEEALRKMQEFGL